MNNNNMNINVMNPEDERVENLSLRLRPPSPPPPQPQAPPSPTPLAQPKPPYAWATDCPTYIHDKSHLEKNFIYTVTGTVRCNKCGKEYPVVFNIEEKLKQFVSFVESKKGTMHDRAPLEWRSPPSLVCEHCTRDGVRPVIDVEKDNINWLFLFLGQMLGYCTLEQLKYFLACTGIHRTAAKDRVLYYTYRQIFKQLLPHLPHQDPW